MAIRALPHRRPAAPLQVSASLGKRSFGPEKLLENFRALIDTVMRLKPSAAKGTYLQAMALATTMGPGIKVDPQSVRKLLEG